MIHHELRAEQKGFQKTLFGSVREIIFGLEDGIVSTLGAITGIAGGTQDPFIVILAGFVIVVVESLSMAAGTYLSSKSEREVEEQMLREEAQEIEENPELERQELVDFYQARGFTKEEIAIVVNRVTSDKRLWLEEMAYRELCVIPRAQKEESPKRDAVIMGISYIVGGFVPLVVYFFLPIALAIPISVVSSVVTLFLVGYLKGKIVQVNRLRSGLEMAIVSLSAAAIGYGVGRLVVYWFGI